ncbi:hypothetical protein ACWCQN_23595 [Streptomyces sp. NPDC001984]
MTAPASSHTLYTAPQAVIGQLYHCLQHHKLFDEHTHEMRFM